MPRQVDTAARLAEISDAVVSLAVDEGFRAVTIRAVAARIGASTSAVTHYVGSREELIRGVVRRETEARRADAEAAVARAGGDAGLRALIEWAVLAPDERAHRFWLALVLGARTEPEVRAELDAFNDWWDTRVRKLVRRAGIPDVQAAVDLLDVVVDGLVLTGFDEGEPWSPGRRRRVLESVWRTLGFIDGEPMGG
ncbi:TetR/AcrR family transcriptional regulator [Nocardia sp. 2]|uniref:TetR/AcrR family transcriptional regulator n=1 Tax=Nocardia acididurans TaxID=2802282 RepID=A0ABS1LYQ1_9NOCA|nr:helix-turn-helix domain-containing protein [Nocardia acididurans]MBL1073543.1 TetR/AcrR family transcriptional regulator [Nocardia acididurans]